MTLAPNRRTETFLENEREKRKIVIGESLKKLDKSPKEHPKHKQVLAVIRAQERK